MQSVQVCVTLDEIVSPMQIEASDLELRFTADIKDDLPESAIRLIQYAEKCLKRKGLNQRFCPRSVLFKFHGRNVQISATELTLRQNPSLAI